MGRRSQRIGQRFEQSIELEDHGLGWLVKIPTARGRDGRERRRTWLDYAGALPGGRSVTFDAKWIGVAERVQRSVLRPHQRQWADQALEAGTLTFVYVGAVVGDRIVRCAVPWEELREVGSLPLAPYVVEGLAEVVRREVE